MSSIYDAHIEMQVIPQAGRDSIDESEWWLCTVLHAAIALSKIIPSRPWKFPAAKIQTLEDATRWW